LIAINIQRYDNFDMLYTVAIMIAPESYSKKVANGLASRISNEHASDENTDIVIEELKQLGFRVASSVNITVGEDL